MRQLNGRSSKIGFHPLRQLHELRLLAHYGITRSSSRVAPASTVTQSVVNARRVLEVMTVIPGAKPMDRLAGLIASGVR